MAGGPLYHPQISLWVPRMEPVPIITLLAGALRYRAR